MGTLAAASLAAAIVTIAAVLGVSLSGGASAAASELRRLGSIASTTPGLQPVEGKYVLARSEEVRPESDTDLATGTTYTVLTHLETQTWIAADGSGFRRTVVRDAELATPADVAAWEAVGRPELPQAGDVRVERYGLGEAPWFDVDALPTDADRLEDTLRSGDPIPWPTDDADVFHLIGELLAQGDASPQLRAALFEVAARLDAVELLGDATDPVGRRGIGLALDGAEHRTRLVFDPTTSQALSIESYPIHEGAVGALESWIATEPATLTETPPPV
jgi:hypothetical protein